MREKEMNKHRSEKNITYEREREREKIIGNAKNINYLQQQKSYFFEHDS